MFKRLLRNERGANAIEYALIGVGLHQPGVGHQQYVRERLQQPRLIV
jgi:hypothetical protein